MLISTSKKFLFLHIPKTAGVSIRQALLPHESIQAFLFRSHQWITDNPRWRLDDLLHYNQQDYTQILTQVGLNVKNYYEFTVVRHPYDRLVSMYHYGLNPERYTTLDLFIDALEHHYHYNNLSNFYHKQTHWINNPLTAGVHVFKYEELDSQWPLICDQLQIPCKPLPKLNVGSTDKTQLTQQQKQRYFELVRDEFETFNYSRD